MTFSTHKTLFGRRAALLSRGPNTVRASRRPCSLGLQATIVFTMLPRRQ